MPEANLSCLGCHGEYEHVESARGEYFECSDCGDVLAQVEELKQLRDDARDDSVSQLAELLLNGGGSE